MAFTIRPLHSDEQKYTYRQSTQIEGQTGSDPMSRKSTN